MLESLLNQLRQVAPDVVEVAVLQPADPFLETAGEDLRRRIFITESIDAVVHCLRPEFTIPICLSHLAMCSNLPEQRRYAYGGTVFRQQRTGKTEFLQVGLEDLGNADNVGADVACISDMAAALAKTGLAQPEIVLGDQNLFAVVVENLQLPQAIAHRLMRSFGAPQLIKDQIDRLESKIPAVAASDEVDKLALAGDREALTAHVEQQMRVANLAFHAGRSPQAIAGRMIEKAREGHFQLSGESAAILRRYLALEVGLMAAPDALAEFARETGLSFGAAGDNFFKRVSALQQAGLNLEQLTYKASFGRNLEYYTGVLFEAICNGVVVAGGGRYDRLCSLLGSPEPVPAVGFSISLDRLEEAR